MLRSNPETLRDFIALEDIAAAVASLLGQPHLQGQVFNLASGQAIRIGEMAQLVAKTASHTLGKEVPCIFEHKNGVQQVPPLQMDTTRLRTLLHITPQNRMHHAIQAIFTVLEQQKDTPCKN